MFDLVKRMAAGVLAILHTRAELLVVELEEEVRRFFAYLILSLVALVCFGIALLLAILLIIVIFWESHRIAVVAGLTGFFGVAAAAIALGVRSSLRSKPKFLGATLGEIARDIEVLRPAEQKEAP